MARLQKGKTNNELGIQVNNYLKEQVKQTPMFDMFETDNDKIKLIREHFKSIMGILGLDLSDDSLNETPTRVAKMYVNEIFWGLNPNNFPKCTVVDNKMKYDEMVVESGISVTSQCEHHFVSILGEATVAYIPKDKVLGLSKMNRIVEYFSRRPQIQERLTEQVFYALKYILGTDNIAVSITADHLCVKTRGVEDVNAKTKTNKLGGAFKIDPSTRAEFMRCTK